MGALFWGLCTRPLDGADGATILNGARGHFRRNGLYVQWQSALPIALVSNKAELRHDAYEAFCASALSTSARDCISPRARSGGSGQSRLFGRTTERLGPRWGHALLIGAGLELYDHLGQPIRYPFPGDAERQRSWVVGGALAQTLAPFGTDLSVNKAPRQEPQWMLAPRTDALCSDPHLLLNRYEGALVGCLIADAITLNTDFLDDIENEPWTTDLGAFGEVSKALVKNLRSQVDRSHEGIELLDERDGLISVFLDSFAIQERASLSGYRHRAMMFSALGAGSTFG